ELLAGLRAVQAGEPLAALDRLAALRDELASDRPTPVTLMSSAEFDDADFNVEYLVDGFLVRGQPMIAGGPSKSCKTLLFTAVAIHGATATPVLGWDKFTVPRPFRSAFVSLESSGATV